MASCSWWSWEMGEPSRLRLSGVCRPLEGGDRSPWWVGDAGALLENKEQTRFGGGGGKCGEISAHVQLLHCQPLLLNTVTCT